MSRSFFNPTTLTGEKFSQGETIESLAASVRDSELLSAYMDADIDATETLEEVGLTVADGLSTVKEAVAQTENIDAVMFNTLVANVNQASALLKAGRSLESVDEGEFVEKKDELLSNLETTVEGFIGDIMSTAGRISRQISNASKNLMTTLFTRQKALGKMADKLQTKMEKYQPGNVDGLTVKVASVSNWFEGPQDAVDKLKTFNGLRQVMPGVQAKLQDLPAAISEKGVDSDKLYANVVSGLKDMAKAPGVKVEHKVTAEGVIDSISVPGTKGRSRVWAVIKSTANVTTSAAAAFGTMAMATMLSGLMIPGPQMVAWGVVLGLAWGYSKSISWAFAKRQATMGWDAISATLEQVSGMATVDLSLKGMTAALAKIEKHGKGLAKAEANPKKALKSLVSVTKMYASVFRDIYSKSVACARAGVAYASASLKQHLKAQATEENKVENDEFYKELTVVTETFESIDNDLTYIDEEAAAQA